MNRMLGVTVLRAAVFPVELLSQQSSKDLIYMDKQALPHEIVDRQLRAYNAHNVDAYCALFAHDALLATLGDRELARGIAEIRARCTDRFKNPALQCEIRARMELGNFVIDHERVVGLKEEPLEAIVIYEVRQSLIRSVRFIWS